MQGLNEYLEMLVTQDPEVQAAYTHMRQVLASDASQDEVKEAIYQYNRTRISARVRLLENT